MSATDDGCCVSCDSTDNLGLARGLRGPRGPAGENALANIHNTIYIDLEFGDDSTALRERWDKPFLTRTAAEAVAVSGDTIVFRPGTYTISGTSRMGKNGVTYYFEAGAIVSGDLRFSDFTAGTQISFNVTGFGEFINGGCTLLYNSTVNFSALKCSNYVFHTDTDGGNYNINLIGDLDGGLNLRNRGTANTNYVNFKASRIVTNSNNYLGYPAAIYVGRRVSGSRLEVNCYADIVLPARANSSIQNQFSQVVWGDNDNSGGADDLTEVNIWGNCTRLHTTPNQGMFYIGQGDTLNVYGDCVDFGNTDGVTEACFFGTGQVNQTWGTATFYGNVTAVNNVVRAIEDSEYNVHFTGNVTTTKAGRAVIDAYGTLGLSFIQLDGTITHTDAGNLGSNAVFMRTSFNPALIKFSQTAKIKIANSSAFAIAWDSATPGLAIIESYPGCTSNEPIETGIVETISNMFIEGTAPPSGSSISYTNGVITAQAVASVAGLEIQTNSTATGSLSQIISSTAQSGMSYNDGGTVVGASNITATEYEHSWTDGTDGGSETIDATKHEITHTLQITVDAPVIDLGTAPTDAIGMYGTTPNVQPTNAIVAAAFVANASGIANDTATYGGYTMGQVVAALKRIGALA